MNVTRLKRLVQMRARMRDVARAELFREEAAQLGVDQAIAQAIAVKNDIIGERLALQSGTSGAQDHEKLEEMCARAAQMEILQRNRRVETEKAVLQARARLLQSEREWDRSQNMLHLARDARDAAEAREIEALPRPRRDPLERL